MRRKQQKTTTWRNSAQIAGCRSILVAELNASTNGAYVNIDIKTIRNMIEICDQAIHTEKAHEPTAIELVEIRKSLHQFEMWQKETRK